MLSVRRRNDCSQIKTELLTMPENLSPEAAVAQSQESADELVTTPTSGRRRTSTNGGGYSPHSTTAATPPSRKRLAAAATAVVADIEDEDATSATAAAATAEVGDEDTMLAHGASSDSDSAADASASATSAPTVRGSNSSSNNNNATSLKNVLAAAVKLSASISRPHSERMLQIVTDLLIGAIDAVEFQQRAVQVIHLPLRPSVLPLLDKQLPWLRREMASRIQSARFGGHHSSTHSPGQQQTTHAYIKEHVKALLSLDRHQPTAATGDSTSSDATVADQLGVWQVFQPGGGGAAAGGDAGGAATTTTTITTPSANVTTRKRRASASLLESSAAAREEMMEETSKRAAWYSSIPIWMPPKVNASTQEQHQQQQQQLPRQRNTTDVSSSKLASSVSYPSALTPFQPQQSPQGDEEWTNIHTMLNCILSMVEKTRRALGILQQRANDNQQQQQQQHQQQQQQKRRESSSSTSSLLHHQVHEASELRRQAGELIAQTLKATEDRVSQVKRKAEEAVHDVRRAAMAELQRALSAERLRAERLAAEARRQGAEEALSALGQHAIGASHHHLSANKEVCWNCGRRANETCSGCNVARYCSTFCQHKHWEVHHKICGRVSHLMLAAAAAAAAPTSGSSVDHRSESGAGSPSSSHLPVGRNSSSKTPSPVQQSNSGPTSYVH